MKELAHKILGCTLFTNKFFLHFYKYKECSICGKTHKQIKCSIFGNNIWEEIINKK